MSSNINILVVEDEPIIAEDVSGFLQDKGYGIASTCYSQKDAMAFLENNTPDMALLDINLGSGHGNEGIEIADFISKHRNFPFIFLTSYTDRKTIDAAKHTHPMGYISKPIDFNSLFSTIEISLHNFSKMMITHQLDLEKINKDLITPITNKEFEIISDIHSGRNNKQIAEASFVSINTVKSHIKNIYDKLNVHSRSELLAEVRRMA